MKFNQQKSFYEHFKPKLYNILYDDSTYPILEQINGPTGRVYATPSSARYPSITTVLGKTKSEKDAATLEKWKKRVGEAEAERIVKKAGARGTSLHKMCEDYILGNAQECPNKISNEFHLFRQVYPHLQKVNNVRGLEARLYSDVCKIAGTADCIADFNDIPSIIDFKSARSERKKEWIRDYFLQCTAYALMYSNMFSVKVQQIVVLISIDNDMFRPESQIFIENPANYVEELFYRIKKYENM